MRLINTTTIKLQDHTLSEPSQHEYAILSHTWEDEEISYQEMISPTTETFKKQGYIKIARTCMQAVNDNLAWVWVDTCCIDKTSSAELTEAINSMYHWYAEASKCYVYLCDLEPEAPVREQLRYCRWFTRGWTLQELLAPGDVEFFDMNWRHRGSRDEYVWVLSECTGISVEVLKRGKPVLDCSVAARMSWASKRRTTRVEDMAYCLLGLFDVNMPLLYGERHKAFRRLQEEIMKRNSDLTILAWVPAQTECDSSVMQAMNLLASSPADFAGGADIVPFSDDFYHFTMTNKGLFIAGEFPLRVSAATQHNSSKLVVTYELYIGTHMFKNGPAVGVCLRKIGPGLFCRDRTFPLGGLGKHRGRRIRLLQARDCYVIVDPPSNVVDMSMDFRRGAIHIPINADWTVKQVTPENIWDARDCLFLWPKLYLWLQYEKVVMAIELMFPLGSEYLNLIVLCDYRENVPLAKIFDVENNPLVTSIILSPRYRENGLLWQDFEIKAPTVTELTDYIWTRVGQKEFKISARFNDRFFMHGDEPINEFLLEIVTDEMPSSR